MDVVYRSFADPGERSILVDTYMKDVEANRISPDFMGLREKKVLLDDDFKLIAAVDKDVKGILQYGVIDPNSVDSVREYIRLCESEKVVDSNGADLDDLQVLRRISRFTKSFSGNFAHIYHLQSFERGHGGKLLNTLRESKDIDGVTLYSTPNAIGFYQRHGFETQDLAISHEDGKWPFMSWKRH